MIAVSLGSNMPSNTGTPRQILQRCIQLLSDAGITVLAQSPIYKTAPYPPMAQPDFLNAVVEIDTGLSPYELIEVLHGIEAKLGRERRHRWEARPIDLDLIDYHQFITIQSGGYSNINDPQYPSSCTMMTQPSKKMDILPDAGEPSRSLPLTLPHPRAHERAFVLLPLRDVAPHWRHPLLDISINSLIESLPIDQICERSSA